MDEKPTTSVAGGGTRLAMVQIDATDGVPKLYCPLCNKALVSLQGYAKHVKKHEPPGGFICRYCPETFCTEEDLKQHRNAVHTTIACRICKSTTFTTEADYRDHIRVVHNGIDRELYKCDKCGAEYKTLDPFQRHMNTNCGTIKPHKCDECPMSFVTKYNLKQHKETHTGERNFCCSYCGKNFLHKGRLVEHERSHTGEKPYKCDVCGKCFAHRESIVTHSSIHTGIRLVECKCCQSRFSCYSNLLKHRRARPETCGLPAYDPPKNRVRQHKSRIPATLNPTSEIRVINMNKIIKPTDVEHMKQTIKKKDSDEQAKSTTSRGRGRGGSRKGVGGRKPKKKILSSEDETSSNSAESAAEDDDDDNIPLSRRKTRHSWPNNINAANKIKKGSDDSSSEDDNDDDDDYIVFDPHEDSDDSDFDANTNAAIHSQFAIKREETEKVTLPESELMPFTPVCDLSSVVKSEDDIFKQKDKLIECLLNDEQDGLVDNDKLAKQREQILHETEIILVKEEKTSVLPSGEETMVDEEEDVLADLKLDMDQLSCSVQLVDVKKEYPTLESADSVQVKRKRRGRKKQIIPDRPKRKYRKNVVIDEDKKPKRVSKIRLEELKKRRSMLKKDVNTFSCPHCIKIYHMRKPFENHLRDDHKESEENIRNVLRTQDIDVESDEVFKCTICDKIYLVEKRLLAHVQLHGPDGSLTYKCPIYCNLYFASKDEATQHAHEAHRDTIYCKLCDRFMKRGLSLKSHMKSQHGEAKAPPKKLERNFVCEKCGKKFPGRTPLSDHVRSDCGRKPLYACHICGKHLTTAGILKTHMLLHKDDTPYQCETCGKTFKVKAQYKAHLKVRHTDDKPFKCHLCPKAYPYRESLLTHMTVHTGIKRFLCNGCGKRFTCISNLQAHRKVQADTCGQLPLNAKATQYMGVQKGNLLLGAKPEAGVNYEDTNTLIAKEVIERDLPMAQDLNYPSEPSEPLATAPLNFTPPAFMTAQQSIKIPHILAGNQQYIEDSSQSHDSTFN